MQEAIRLSHPKHWLSWFWVFLLRLLGLLPFPMLYALGGLLGELLFLLVRKRVHITLTNLRLCLPELTDKQRKKIARRHFRLLTCSTLSIGAIWWASKSRMRRLVKIKGVEHLEKAQKAGQGVILLAPHFVTLDAGGIALSVNHRLTSMYQTHRNPVFDHTAIKQRSRFGLQLFNRKAPLTRLIKSIRKGDIFYYLPDQNAGAQHGLFVPFFGIEASTFPMLGKMSLAAKAVVIPCTNRIIPWRGIETTLHPPLENFPIGDPYEDTKRMNDEVAKLAKTLGADYLWSHKRFKRRPEGEPDLYR